MSIYGHALFWSATACVLAALVVCTLVLRYGFTRDSDPAGRWGWRPTRAGHGLAAALFGAGLVLTILALTAVPLGGKERPRVLGDALRAQLEALRGRLGDFEDAVARLASERLRRATGRRLASAPTRSRHPTTPTRSAGGKRARAARRGLSGWSAPRAWSVRSVSNGPTASSARNVSNARNVSRRSRSSKGSSAPSASESASRAGGGAYRAVNAPRS